MYIWKRLMFFVIFPIMPIWQLKAHCCIDWQDRHDFNIFLYFSNRPEGRTRSVAKSRVSESSKGKWILQQTKPCHSLRLPHDSSNRSQWHFNRPVRQAQGDKFRMKLVILFSQFPCTIRYRAYTSLQLSIFFSQLVSVWLRSSSAYLPRTSPFCYWSISICKEHYQPCSGNRDWFTLWFVLLLLLTHWIIAGLDIGRFHWSDTIPPSVQIMGLIGMVVSLGLAMWATKINPFFSPALRIQQERGHFLVTTGPYKYVRHPGYLAGIFSFLFGTIVLGSCWAILPVIGYIILILRRTALEDQFLQKDLEGYKEYVQKTPYRLFPCIWWLMN